MKEYLNLQIKRKRGNIVVELFHISNEEKLYCIQAGGKKNKNRSIGKI